MLRIYTVAFFGHRYMENMNEVEALLEGQIKMLVDQKEYVDFLVGRSGDFDQCVSSAIRRVRKRKDYNSSHVLVLPYPTAEYLNNEDYFLDYYSEVDIPISSSRAHPKAAFLIRNREMVDRADLVICYVNKKSGGAWQAVKYAMENGKPIINLAE